MSTRFRSWKEICRGFSFLWKEGESENSAQCLFCSESFQRQCLLVRHWHHRAPSPGTTSQQQATVAFRFVWVHPCFISIYFVLLWARCVLRWLVLQFTLFWLMKTFIRMFYFWIVWRKPVIIAPNSELLPEFSDIKHIMWFTQWVVPRESPININNYYYY